jgi:hypoxanthine phosphoribosyltransferase
MADPESFRCKLVTWNEIAEWTTDLANELQENGVQPTVVVGLTRGGWVPARLLCDHLMVKKLYAVKTEHWGVTANQNGKALLTQELSVNIAGESVLVVDDITDTGESLTLAMAHLCSLGAKNTRSATLLHFNHSKFVPDHCSRKLPDDPWIWFIFPWNLHEDLRTLLPKTLTEPRTEEGIRQAFRDQFFIDVPEELLPITLRDLEKSGKIVTDGNIVRMR